MPGDRDWSHDRGWRGGPGHGPAMMRRGPGMPPPPPGMRHDGGPGMHRGGMGGGMGCGMMQCGSMMGGGMGMGMGRGMGGHRFMDKIQLDDAQKTKMVDIMTNAFRDRLMARMELQDAMKKLRALQDADTPDYDAILEANKDLGAAKGKLDVAKRKMRTELRAVLTPEQAKQLDEWEKDFPRRGDKRDDGGKRMQRPEHRGPGPRMERGPGPERGPRP